MNSGRYAQFSLIEAILEILKLQPGGLLPDDATWRGLGLPQAVSGSIPAREECHQGSGPAGCKKNAFRLSMGFGTRVRVVSRIQLYGSYIVVYLYDDAVEPRQANRCLSHLPEKICGIGR
jgi:hypothetical protein